MTRLEQLPDDPALLKRMILDREALIERIRNEAAEQLEAQRLRLEAEKRAEIKAAVEAVLRRHYGPKTERFDPLQLLLFGRQVEATAEQLGTVAEFDTEAEPIGRRKKPAKRHDHGRNKLPEHLPRIPIEHDLSDDEKKCPCCGEVRCRIGEEVSEQLEIIPAKFQVLKHVRFKYACRACEAKAENPQIVVAAKPPQPIERGLPGPGSAKFQVLKHVRFKYACRACEAKAENPQIVVAAKPPQPIERGLPGPGLLAYLVTSKWSEHLPLYRLEAILKRAGVHVSRSTMCGWLAACGVLVQPLVELMTRRIRASRVIHTDDTRIPVQDPDARKCKSGRIWAYIGDVANPYVVYDYTPDRTRAGPVNWLRDYRGHLQADAYGGYDGIYHSGAIEVACWTHARRYFFNAKETDMRRAATMIEFVRRLYAIETEARDLADDARRDVRQAQSRPILNEIKAWLDAEREIVLPRSEMGKAFTYVLNQWTALNTYVTEGFLNIDNNAAEQAVKRVAIGRKNWLFAGSDAAGGTAARLYSLVAGAERHGLDPQRYLTSVLARLPGLPESDLHRLLPDEWKRADGEEPAQAEAPAAS
jgi:transposase